MNKIGIVIGNGKLPLYFLNEAKKKEFDIYPIGLFDTVDEEIKKHKNYISFNIGQIGGIVKFLRLNEINKVVLLGKVDKTILFKKIEFDYFGKELLEKLPDRKDETLLFGIISFLKLNKIKVLPQNYLLKHLVVKKICYTEKKPNNVDIKTIKLGIEAAKSLSRIDAGQSVVCKDNSVVALEGIEGTDKTIERAGFYAGENCIVVKMSRPQQDMRVDIPVIGLQTIKKVIEIKGKGIVIEAKKMLFVDMEECIKLATRHGIFIIGVKI